MTSNSNSNRYFIYIAQLKKHKLTNVLYNVRKRKEHHIGDEHLIKSLIKS